MQFDEVRLIEGVLVLMQNGVEVFAVLPKTRKVAPFTTDRGPLKPQAVDFGMRHRRGSLLEESEKLEEQYQIDNEIA